MHIMQIYRLELQLAVAPWPFGLVVTWKDLNHYYDHCGYFYIFMHIFHMQ